MIRAARLAPFFALVCHAAIARADASACDDAALSEAAAALLLGPSAPDATGLVDAARDSGSTAVRLLAVREPLEGTGSAALLRDAAARESASTLVCGEAATETERLRIVGREGGRLSAVLGTTGWIVRASLRPGVGPVEIVVRGIDGSAIRRTLTASTSDVPLPSTFPARFAAQLLGETATGPLPLAELSVGAPAEPAAEDATVAGTVGRIRRLAGVSPIRENALLDRVATAQATAVCAAGRAGHDSGDGDPVQRLARAGLEARSVGEVVGRGTNRSEVLRALESSPSHRLELEADEYTDVGVGEHVLDGHTCVVVVLASFPRYAGH